MNCTSGNAPTPSTKMQRIYQAPSAMASVADEVRPPPKGTTTPFPYAGNARPFSYVNSSSASY